MTKLVKLTGKDNRSKWTPNTNTLAIFWGENITHEIGVTTPVPSKYLKGDGYPIDQELCNDHWLHAYETIELASMFRFLYAYYDDNVKAWEAEGEIGLRDKGKLGCKKITTIKEINLLDCTVEMQDKVIATSKVLLQKEDCQKPLWNYNFYKVFYGSDNPEGWSWDYVYALDVLSRNLSESDLKQYAEDLFRQDTPDKV